VKRVDADNRAFFMAPHEEICAEEVFLGDTGDHDRHLLSRRRLVPIEQEPGQPIPGSGRDTDRLPPHKCNPPECRPARSKGQRL